MEFDFAWAMKLTKKTVHYSFHAIQYNQHCKHRLIKDMFGQTAVAQRTTDEGGFNHIKLLKAR